MQRLTKWCSKTTGTYLSLHTLNPSPNYLEKTLFSASMDITKKGFTRSLARSSDLLTSKTGSLEISRPQLISLWLLGLNFLWFMFKMRSKRYIRCCSKLAHVVHTYTQLGDMLCITHFDSYNVFCCCCCCR